MTPTSSADACDGATSAQQAATAAATRFLELPPNSGAKPSDGRDPQRTMNALLTNVAVRNTFVSARSLTA